MISEPLYVLLGGTAGLLCAVFVAAVARAIHRTPAPPALPFRPRIAINAIRPSEQAEALVDSVARSTLRRSGSIWAGDVRCSCTWLVDMSSSRLGSWRVQVGERVSYTQDLGGVYMEVEGRLREILRERAGRRAVSR